MRRSGIWLLSGVVLLAVGAGLAYGWRGQSRTVVLKLDESWETARERNGLPNRSQEGKPLATVIAAFRLDDPVYGFTTPRAVLLDFGLDGRDSPRITSVHLLPQAHPLVLDDAMTLVMQLQHQLRQRGWRPVRYPAWRPFEDTEAFRARIRGCEFPMAVWNGGETYQVSLKVGCASVIQSPGAERYEVDLELGRPFWKDIPGQ
jgi:hypothetical protein